MKRNLPPEKGPAIRINVRHLRSRGRSTCIRATCSIGSAMRAVILVICDEDSEGLGGRCAGVVGAFRCLDGFGHFRGCVECVC